MNILRDKASFAAVILMLGLILSSCTSTDIQTYAEIDPSDKSVTVPPGGGGFIGGIKSGLRKNGWRLMIYQGPSITA